MAFRGLTKKGADYLATRLANELAVEFLKVEIGDGAVISGQNPKNQTSLISYKKDVRILKKEQENNAINLTIQITNDDITQGFYLKEIGIYVNDSSSNGCLYWYCNEDNAQYIPAKTDSVIAFEIDIRMEVTNSDATIINWSGKNTWINKEYLEENYTQNGGYKGTAQEIDDRVVSALGKEDGKFPLNEAIQGNVYYFPANKKFYICKETQNRRISVPDVKFEELSIWENRKRLENLYTIKEEKTKITFKEINNINLNTITESGFYVSPKWDANIVGLPQELDNNNGRAFYLKVMALKDLNNYCQQILYSFKGLIFYRAIIGANSTFTQWNRLRLT
ncbi:phage tail protein [Fusobacterium polymorphum]|uniref:phage tail protein n=2 Tax=Fusobacterium nucleatum subsp. polymorphum TaxID=76857 RepID=UPI002B4C1517|nr:phage tail protein [Fusobacterium polymorphum]WRL72602.1 phage tail protein [Fusobacterium polymorphum]